MSTVLRPSAGFARTKIQPPRPRSGALIERPALEARLGAALLSHKLVLVSAAAGFGKTSALARQIGGLPAGSALAWIGCDEGDAAPTLFECLIAALEPWDPPWRVAPEALVATAAEVRSPAALRALSAEVINALHACEVPHGVLVIDDLHRIAQPEVFEFIDQLLERLSPHWTLVIATRQDPPIALARLRARGEIAEFRFDDLRFDRAEARALAAGAGLDEAAADALFERSQGWPVGLRLALNALRGAGTASGIAWGAALGGDAAGASAGGSAAPVAATPTIDRHVFDFLATEVLDRQPEALRQFLLRCAVLDELTAARCAAVSGDARAAQHLDDIERAGLFVSTLAEDEPTLRLHDLFRDALLQRLKRDHGAELPQLLRRAAAGEPQPLRRIGYLLQAEAWDEAAAELRRHAPALLTNGRIHAVLRCADQFPADRRESLPDVQLALSMAGWARWHWPSMLQSAQRAAAGFHQRGQAEQALEAEAYAAVGLHGCNRLDEGAQAVRALAAPAEAGFRALLAAGPASGNEPAFVAHALVLHLQLWNAYDDARIGDLPPLLARELDLLEHCSQPESWYRAMPLPSFVGLPGMHPLLMRFASGVLARIVDDGSDVELVARGLRGSALVWAGRLDEGRRELEEAAAEVRWRDMPLRGAMHVHLLLVAACALQADHAALQRHAGELDELLRRAGSGRASQSATNAFFTLARWLLAAGDKTGARRLFELADDGGRGGANEARPVLRVQRLSLPGYLAWIAGEWATAQRAFSAALVAGGAALELFGQASELRLRLAVLQLQSEPGGVPAAAATLQPLFVRHAADEDIAAVWLVGPALLGKLAGQRWGSALGSSQQALLQRWATQAAATADAGQRPEATMPGYAGSTSPPAAALPAGLTPREFEVLERIAAGDSNKLIARAFDLSPHTVKRHVANILDKLALSSRGQAAAWLREHG